MTDTESTINLKIGVMDPDRVIRLTPVNAQNEENILELDPTLIIGWMGFPATTIIYINGPEGHSIFSVTESVDEIKRQLREFISSS